MDSDLDTMRLELVVQQRVQQLRREGMWTRLKSVSLPKVPKCHWDYVLEEALWMSNMFQQERILKDKLTKKCAKIVQSHFRAEEVKMAKLAKELEVQRRRNANQIAKIVKQFWSNASKLVDYKLFSIFSLARRRSLHEKLNRVLSKSGKFAEEFTLQLENQQNVADEKVAADDDLDFESPVEIESDVEETIEQEEKQSHLKADDYRREIDELEDENNMSLEEILAKYSDYLEVNMEDKVCLNSNVVVASPASQCASTKENLTTSSMSSPNTYTSRLRGRRASATKVTKIETNNNHIQEEDTEGSNVGLKDLFSDEICHSGSNFQPSGHTLESTKVTTTIPFILRHQLREYQHIGLEWLVTLYDRHLNGILADEMGIGKTIQTIALLAYLAVEKGNWGPHLIIVPSSLMMNWELEFLRWCPSFKIMTYYGSTKERKQRRMGWSEPNSFHICITSYTIAVQDHLCFRRKPWEYMILDEAHHIKNFKSQRWQVLLNFNTKRRLLLTGTPLQNNLMELWSLLHFLTPHVFESHSEFREWFSKPIAEIASGSREYNESVVKLFHKTLRPFMLRRLKSEVEKQMPQKVEHVLKCRLSKRQRYLYDEFMARADTKNSITAGSFLNVLNVLMQLRKVCNHPDLFEPRPVVSSLRMDDVGITYPKCVWNVSDFDFNVNELMNMVLYAGAIVHPELPEFIYEERVPVRNIKDHDSQKPVVNLFVDAEEMPRPKVEVSLHAWDSLGKLALWTWEFAQPDSVVSLDDDALNVAMDHEIKEIALIPHVHSQNGSEYSSAAWSPSTEESEIMNPEYINYDEIDDDNDDYSQELVASYVNLDRPASPSEYALKDIYKAIENDRKSAVQTLNKVNQRRHQIYPLLDPAVVQCCTILGRLPDLSTLDQQRKFTKGYRLLSKLTGFGGGGGYAAIRMITAIRQHSPNFMHHPLFMWRISFALYRLIGTVQQQINSFSWDFLVYISPVSVKGALFEKIYSPATAALQYRSLQARGQLRQQLSRRFDVLHPITSRLTTAFPDPRLVEYDCGKLQVLNGLLRRLKVEGHKVLLFTQMTKMLNILETFLNYQGHIYLRMDGGTDVGQRQLLVERFNKDAKIFIFLLSTRAGGLGINLTGADTVIFYDSDWNPTIDAQAQDRCHRIGQTRDVHIYRLISENSVEENILKTSRQKKLLGEHAIEEGKFNLDYFKKNSFRSLFNLPDPAADCITMTSTVAENVNIPQSEEALEKALAAAEDDADDRMAAVTMLKEVEAEHHEFSEDPTEKTAVDLKRMKDDFQNLYSLCNGAERYALNFLDPAFNEWSDLVIEELIQSFMKDVESDEDEGTSSGNEKDALEESGAFESVESTDDEMESSSSDSESYFIPVLRNIPIRKCRKF